MNTYQRLSVLHQLYLTLTKFILWLVSVEKLYPTGRHGINIATRTYSELGVKFLRELGQHYVSVVAGTWDNY